MNAHLLFAPAATGCTERRGSALVPLVAAMLILFACGVSLSELFAAQRRQAVLGIESAQAFWIAEAGTWHAALVQSALGAPVAFAGGTYVVSKSGSEFEGTGRSGNATRHVAYRIEAGSGVFGGTGTADLDAWSSASTAAPFDATSISIDLSAGSALELTSFALGATTSTELVEELTLDGTRIWHDAGGVELYTESLSMTDGSAAERTLSGGSDTTLRVTFADAPLGTVTYVLLLEFTDGESSTLFFTVEW